MKRLFILFAAIAISSSFCTAQKGLEEKLPKQIQNYLQTYFRNHKVVKYKSEMTLETAKYKVFMGDGVNVTFDEDFLPTIIDSETGLPDNVVPKNILTYTKKHFPTHQIRQWQKRAINQIILLNDGTKIKFDLSGQLVRLMRRG